MKLCDFLSELGTPIIIYPSLARLLGLKESMMVSQLCYWTGKERTGDGWIYKSADNWTAELGLSRREQEGARCTLRKMGLLEERHERLKHRLHYRLDTEKLEELWKASREEKAPLANGENEQFPFHKKGNGEPAKAPSGIQRKRHSLLSKITSELTPETTTTRSRGRAASPPGGCAPLEAGEACSASPAPPAAAQRGEDGSSSTEETISSQQVGAQAPPPVPAPPPSNREVDEDTFAQAFAKLWTKTGKDGPKLRPADLLRVRKLARKNSLGTDNGYDRRTVLFWLTFSRTAWRDWAKERIEETYDEGAFPAKFGTNIGLFFSKLDAVEEWYAGHIDGARRACFSAEGTRKIVGWIATACSKPAILEEFVQANAEDFERQRRRVIDEERMEDGMLTRFIGYVGGRESEKAAEMWTEVTTRVEDERVDDNLFAGSPDWEDMACDDDDDLRM